MSEKVPLECRTTGVNGRFRLIAVLHENRSMQRAPCSKESHENRLINRKTRADAPGLAGKASVHMTVVHVREVRMPVGDRLVLVRMHMRLLAIPISFVLVLMVFVVHMGVAVL